MTILLSLAALINSFEFINELLVYLGDIVIIILGICLYKETIIKIINILAGRKASRE